MEQAGAAAVGTAGVLETGVGVALGQVVGGGWCDRVDAAMGRLGEEGGLQERLVRGNRRDLDADARQTQMRMRELKGGAYYLTVYRGWQ